VNYGQKHAIREIESACKLLEFLGDRIEMRSWRLVYVSGLRIGSALTSPDISVPEGEYVGTPSTFVPGRNAFLLSLAAGVAMSEGGSVAAIGVHGRDYPYPDCSPTFIRAMDEAVQHATSGHVRVYAPYLEYSKAEIVREALYLGVPLDVTWSCYVGGDKPCGKCPTCIERKRALMEAGVPC